MTTHAPTHGGLRISWCWTRNSHRRYLARTPGFKKRVKTKTVPASVCHRVIQPLQRNVSQTCSHRHGSEAIRACGELRRASRPDKNHDISWSCAKQLGCQCRLRWISAACCHSGYLPHEALVIYRPLLLVSASSLKRASRSHSDIKLGCTREKIYAERKAVITIYRISMTCITESRIHKAFTRHGQMNSCHWAGLPNTIRSAMVQGRTARVSLHRGSRFDARNRLRQMAVSLQTAR